MLRNLSVLVVTLLLLLNPVYGDTAATGWVRDSAGVLSTATRTRLQSLLEQVHQQTTAEVMVITVDSLNGEDVDSFATQMFNQIGIGDRDRNNGVLFLIAPNERRTRIEVGYGLETLITDDVAGRMLDIYVVPAFRVGDMDAGIGAGTEAIARLLLGNPRAAHGIAGSAPLFANSRTNDLVWALYGLGGLAVLQFGIYVLIGRRKRFPVLLMYGINALALGLVALVAIAWYALGRFDLLPPLPAVLGGGALMVSSFLNLRRFRRYRPRTCTHCGGPQQLLSEQREDSHLNAVQQLEEQLGSVDYDVWYCPACLKSDTERYVATFSAYRDCPKCRARTFKETRTTLVAATQSHGGKVRLDGRCESCQHTATRVENTPRLSSSSGSGSSGGGSSGGSSGGGRSGGGGASRSW
ncbi:MAG: TPM domain-containing protein [Gammaproteobacteria bacterium]